MPGEGRRRGLSVRWLATDGFATLALCTPAQGIGEPRERVQRLLTTAYNTLGGNIVFNAVAIRSAADRDELGPCFLYTECWPFLADTMTTSRTPSTTMTPGARTRRHPCWPHTRTVYANSYSSTDPGFFNTPGVLYEDATIFASGGDHIELGDVTHARRAELPERQLVHDRFVAQSMVNYYNFLTAYEDLLRAERPELERNRPPRSPTTSTNGSAGRLTFASSASGTDVVQFINMLNLTSND